MRFIVYGAGAVGGALGARLHQAGQNVVLIARGPHLAEIRKVGLRVQDPETEVTVPVPAVESPDEVDWRPGDVVLLAVKSNATPEVVQRLTAVANPATPVCCVQNGVGNESVALRHFANVYGVCVMMPVGHLAPGVVQAYSTPVTGILDLGRFPGGVDRTAEGIAAALTGASFVSVPRPDLMRWKYRKLLMNLGNAVDAVTRPEPAQDELIELAREEGERVLAAAGIDVVSMSEDEARRADILTIRRFGDQRPGGSSWQSLHRGTGSIETDHLNGEIALLGRLYGVPAPCNELLQRVANEAARLGHPPGAVATADLLAQLRTR